MKRLCWIVLLIQLELFFVSADRSVHILAENLEQVVTSTTLEWVPTNGYYDKDLLKNAVIAAYQTVEGNTNKTNNINAKIIYS